MLVLPNVISWYSPAFPPHYVYHMPPDPLSTLSLCHQRLVLFSMHALGSQLGSANGRHQMEPGR